MKSRITCVLLIFLLSTSITACSNSKNNLNQSSRSVSSKKISSTGISTNSTASSTDISSAGTKDENTNTSMQSNNNPVSSDNSSVLENSVSENSILEKYKAVLLDNAEFYSTDNNKQLSLDDFLTGKEIYADSLEATRFTVIDMDGDEIPEIILELTVDEYPEFYEVLHYMNGTVYGYNFPYRGLHGLKTDGTFHYSNGASDNGYGKLKFQTTGYEVDKLGYMSSTQNNEGTTISYFINNKPVSENSYNSFSKEQDEKKDADWTDYTRTDVEKALSSNP